MGQRFRVANINASNFNFPGIRFAGRDGDDGAPVREQDYHKKVEWLVDLLGTTKADLIGFEELFSWPAIDEVVSKVDHLADATIYAPDLIDNIIAGPTGPEARGPFCGLVTRFPIVAQEAILDFPDDVKGKLRVRRTDGSDDLVAIPIEQFQRPVLRVDVKLRPETVATVFVAHLKSKTEQFFAGEDHDDPVVQALGSARSLIIRAAEAAALRSLIVAASTGNQKPILVLGDLNDDLGSVTTQMIGGDDPSFLPEAKKPAVWDRLLYSVHDIQEQHAHRQFAYSHIYNSRYELLDHIFVSQELVAQNPAHIAEVRNTQLYNDHLFDAKLTSGSAKWTSDHGVPVTEIEFKTAGASA